MKIIMLLPVKEQMSANSDGFYSWGGLLALIPLMESGYWDYLRNKRFLKHYKQLIA